MTDSEIDRYWEIKNDIAHEDEKRYTEDDMEKMKEKLEEEICALKDKIGIIGSFVEQNRDIGFIYEYMKGSNLL